MRFAVLGPLEVHADSGRVRLAAHKQQTILALLLSRYPRPVPVDTLLAALWNGSPPTSGRKALAWHVLQLRTALGDKTWVGHGPDGYRLGREPAEVDAWRFEAMLERGSRLLPDDPDRASAVLAEAVGLWRGPAYGDIAERGVLCDEARRLDELRLVALERRCDAELAAARHHGLIPELTALVNENPFREALRAKLMLALYRSGRQDEALRVFRTGRDRLRDELGIEPGAELNRLHKRILAADPSLGPDAGDTAVSAEPVRERLAVPSQLPADAGVFTGRDREIAEVLRRIRDSTGDHPAGSPVTAINGMPGIGKTAMAVHIAHGLAPEYPDGRLFIDLHGFSGDVAPLPVTNALEYLLHGLGVDKTDIPDDVDARTAMYRTILARRRVLIVLDNVLGEEQVRRLIPGLPGCLVLMTSRHPLGALDDAHHVALQAMRPTDAAELFRRVAGDERMAEVSASELAEVVELCGGLPLALRIAAARFRLRRHWRIGDLVAKLSDHTRALSELATGDLSVAATFQLSYRHLDDRQRRLFRLLGTHVGADVSLPGAAALAAMPVHATEPLLDGLVDAQLLRESPAGRFGFHDLLRAFARDLSHAEDSTPDRDAAQERLFAWYAHSARSAAIALRPYREVLDVDLDATDLAPLTFDGPDAAMRWFTTEEDNLAAIVTTPRDHHPARPVWLIVDAMRGFCYLHVNRRTWHDLARTAKDAVTDDDGAEAAMTHSLGLALSLGGRYPDAEDQYRRGIELTRRTGDERRRVEILLCLAGLLAKSGDSPAAITLAREASTLTRRHGDRMRSDALHILGGAHLRRGELRQAAAHLSEAVARERTRGFDNLLTTLSTLTDIHIELGALDEAEKLVDEVLSLAERLGSPSLAAHAWLSLSWICSQRQLHEQAVDFARSAADIGVAAMDAIYEPTCHVALAMATLPLSPKDALELARRAHDTAAEHGFTDVHRDALECMSHASRLLGDLTAAREHASEALRVDRACGYVLTEGKSLIALTAAHVADGDYRQALDFGQQALDILSACEHRLGEANTHHWLAEAHHGLGDTAAADTHRRRAEDIRRDIGVPTTHADPL